MQKFVSVGAILATVALASAAHATVYDFALTVSDPSASLTGNANGVDSFGNVAVDDSGGNLAFDVTINSSWELRHANDANHWTFAFNTAKAFTYSGVTFLGGKPATATPATNVNASPFGTFTNALACDLGGSVKGVKSACQTGWTPTVNPTELKFTAVGLQITDLAKTTTTFGGNTTWFIADLVNSAGKTGNVGAQDCVTSTGGSCFGGGGGGGVPEPAAWALMILGLGGVGAATRFRSQAARAS
jgi:hypothetical protein